MPPGRHQSRRTPHPPAGGDGAVHPAQPGTLSMEAAAGRSCHRCGMFVTEQTLYNGNQGTENMNPTLQPGSPAPTLANEDPGTAGGSGETWQREPRGMSWRNQDSLGQQPAGPPEAAQPPTAYPVTSRCVRALPRALSTGDPIGSALLWRQSWKKPFVS